MFKLQLYQNHLDGVSLEQTAGLHARVCDSIGLECCLDTGISNKFAGSTAAAGQGHTLRTADPESDKRRIAVFPTTSQLCQLSTWPAVWGLSALHRGPSWTRIMKFPQGVGIKVEYALNMP